MPAYKFIDPEQIILGFFYFYIFKDFVLREVIFWFSGSEDMANNELKYMFIDKIGLEYNKFIMYDFVQWINLMLNTEIF